MNEFTDDAGIPTTDEASDWTHLRTGQAVTVAERGRPALASGHGVFLLDDHELVRRGLRHLLAAAGIPVLGESASARQALRRLPALRPQLAILDDHLPDGTGAGVCKALRAADPRIRCLILVDTADEDALMTAVLSDAWGCLSKQDENREQLRLIRRALAGGLAFSNRFRHLLQQGGTSPQNLPPESKLLSLTRQETNAVIGLSKGMSNRQIARDLNISEKSVKNLVSSALAKLGMVGRTQAAVFMATSADRSRGPGYRYLRSPEMIARAAAALEICTQDGPVPIDDAARAKSLGALAAALTDFGTVRNSGPRPVDAANAPGSFPGGIQPDALCRRPGTRGAMAREPRWPRQEIAAR